MLGKITGDSARGWQDIARIKMELTVLLFFFLITHQDISVTRNISKMIRHLYVLTLYTEISVPSQAVS